MVKRYQDYSVHVCVCWGGGGGVPLQKFQFANLINSVDKCKDKFHFHTPGVP